MDEMREIVTVDQVNRLFVILAICGPVAGAVLGWLAHAGKRTRLDGLRTGLAIGLIGPANLLLWHMYNAITDRLGLDTVKNLLVNLGLFVALGVAAGLALGRRRRAHEGPSTGGQEAAPVVACSPDPDHAPGAARQTQEAADAPNHL